MNNDAVPSDIRNPKYTLMVEGWTTGGFIKMNNRAFENTLSKHYPEKYVLVQPEDTSNKKYADRSNFRYYISFMRTLAISTSGPGAIKSGTYGTNAYGVIMVYDRLTGNVLGHTGEQMQSYTKSLKFFSEFVKKNR